MELPEKYSKDAPFDDPVVRCTECQRLVHREEVAEVGCCPGCGNRRMRNVLAMSGEEMSALSVRGIDPDFLALFEVRGC